MPSLALVDSEDVQDRLIQEHYLECLEAMLEEARDEMGAVVVPGGSLSPRCPRVWDGILCWTDADPGETATMPCPDYVAGFVTEANATRSCLGSGEWYSRPEEPNATWTNYSQCAPSNWLAQIVVGLPHPSHNESLMAEWVPIVKKTATVGYTVSLITLILAFIIMASIRRLRCPRNVLHMHLFASFIMRAFMSLLKDTLFIKGIDLTSEAFVQGEDSLILSEEPHGWQCKMVISLWQFFIVANYSWVFMEGLYLHNLIFHALFSDTSSIATYVVLGWGLPFLSVVPWITFRAIFEDTYCWTTNGNPLLFLVIRIPIETSILINFVLFVKIVRVVFKKLQSSISEETRRYRYRRWAKSTLVLVPLFGIHYTLFLGMSFAIGINPVVEIVWLYCDLFFASFQGAFVAVLYCFMNGEVKTEISKLWERSCRRRSRPRGMFRPTEWLPPGGGPLGAIGNGRSKANGSLLAPHLGSEENAPSGGNQNHAVFTAEGSDGDGGVPPGHSKGVEVQLQPVRSFKFPVILRRQLSAPPGSGDVAAGEGLVSRAVRSDVIQGTKLMALKWRSHLGSRRRRSPAFASSSSARTTHCSIDCGGEEDGQPAPEGQGRPLLSEGPTEEPKKGLQRSASPGVPSKSKSEFRKDNEPETVDDEQNGECLH